MTVTGGNDPELDGLICDLGLQLGIRRGGCTLLTCKALNADKQMIEVRDKFDSPVWMPASGDLIARLQRHAIERGGPQCDRFSGQFQPDAPVLWYLSRRGKPSTPLTDRRFDTLIKRWQTTVRWANEDRVGFHYLRHSMSEILKARYGHHYAKRFLRHTDGDVTDIYGRCTDAQLAGALGELFGYSHPLVEGFESRRADALNRLMLD